jgi:hypothetical protein
VVNVTDPYRRNLGFEPRAWKPTETKHLTVTNWVKSDFVSYIPAHFSPLTHIYPEDGDHNSRRNIKQLQHIQAAIHLK